MKRKKRLLRFFLLIILSISILKSYSQIPVSPGFVVLNNNDTIYGNIEYSRFSALNKCVIIKNGTSTIQILKPEQVSDFFISPDLHFQSQHIGNRYTFLQLISEGKINLYKGSKGLYISCNSDNLVLLDHEKEYITKNGRMYLAQHNAYKTSIKSCITDTSFYRKIDELSSDINTISKLIQEINNHDLTPHKKPESRILHKNLYSLGISYSVNKFSIPDLKYRNDSLFFSYGDDTKPILNAWQIGFSFKRNLKSTHFYLYGGLEYSKMQKESFDRPGIIYSTEVFPSRGSSYFEDSIGNIKDQFRYEMTLVSIPLGFYEEITHNRLRPFYSAGFSANYFLKKTIVLSRTVKLNNVTVEDYELELDTPAFSFGTTFDIGCRYLINANHSISLGINWNLLITNHSTPVYLKAINRRFYFAFNF
jgi:hypothetical protein